MAALSTILRDKRGNVSLILGIALVAGNGTMTVRLDEKLAGFKLPQVSSWHGARLIQ